tara:strand:+ start:1495 stop:2628 length:1134 start_codon:yes stop_codon:yes gene_type:complete
MSEKPKPRIPYTKPSITKHELAYVADAATNGWGEACYDYIHRFEGAFREHLGTKFSIATSSCTGSLHMGMAALGIGPGDEVILADTNWIASVAPIVHLSATPVFVDILPDTWCIDPALVEAAITPKTKAILAVHLYGNLCEMDALRAIAKSHDIHLIEDAAEAIGSEYKGELAGSMGVFGAFSFHGTKTMTTGEGGMFVTNDGDLYEKVLTLSNHGRSRSQVKQFWPEAIGFKYKISNVQAAIGLAQTERIEELIQRKRQILDLYQERFAHLEGVTLNAAPPSCKLGAWMPTIVFDEQLGIRKEALLTAFANADIDARVFFPPLSSLPPLIREGENVGRPIAWSIPERAVNLPSFHDMDDHDIDRVEQVIMKVYGER